MSIPENSLMATSTSSWMTPGFVKSPGTPTASPPRPLISSQIESHTLLRGGEEEQSVSERGFSRTALGVSAGIPRVLAKAKRGRDSPVQVVENESGSVLSEENGGLPPDAPPGPGDDGNASLEQSGRGSAPSAREVPLHHRYSSPVRHRCRFVVVVVVVALFGCGKSECAFSLDDDDILGQDFRERLFQKFIFSVPQSWFSQSAKGGGGEGPRRRRERGSLLGKSSRPSSRPREFVTVGFLLSLLFANLQN